MYDRVSISLHGPHAQTNYPVAEYEGQECGEFQGLAREELQRALGVKPMDKSSRSAAALQPCVMPAGRCGYPVSPWVFAAVACSCMSEQRTMLLILHSTDCGP